MVAARFGLEREAGTSLVHRTTRKLALTEDGAAFYDRAKAITREIEAATAELAERRGELTGPLRIAAPLSFGTLHLGPALYPSLAAHPGIELMLDLDDRFVDLASESYDLAIRVGQVADSRLIARPLAPSRRVLVASPAYLEREGTPRTLTELEAHTAVGYTNRGPGDWRFRSVDKLVTLRTARTALRVNNGDVICEASAAGLGVALLPTSIASTAIRAGRLVSIDVRAEAETDLVHAASADGKHRSEKARVLVEHLRNAFGDPAYWDARVQ